MQMNSLKTLINRGVIVSLMLLVSACGGVDDQQSVDTAKNYLETNQLREASLELRNALKANPQNAEARYLLGKLNVTFGDMASAVKDFRKARESGWDEGEAQLGILRALVGSHQFRKALDTVNVKDAYSDAVNANIYGLRAFAQAALGDIDKAVALLDKGSSLDPSAFDVMKTQIQLDYTSGKLDAADALVAQTLAAHGPNAEILMLSAYGALQANDTDRAIEQFNKILTMEPAGLVTFIGRSARLGYARIEINEKRYDNAHDLLKPLFKQSPNDPETNYIGALLAFEKGAYNLAEERILKVFKLVPEHAKTQLLYGTVHFARKDYEQASYYLSKYLQKVPDNVGARKLLGRTYMLLGQHDKANATLQPGLEASEDDAELLALVGLSQLQSGNVESGISGLKSALDAAPESKALRSELAKAYITAGETENAINQLNTLLAEGGDKNQAQVLMVSAYLRAQEYDEAIKVAFDMLERNPEDPATIALVGNVFAASGDSDEARRYFNRALEKDADYSLAIMLLASLEETDNNFDAAEALYRRNLKIADDINPMLALARLAGKRGDDTAMRDWLEKARAQDEKDLRSRLVLAEYYLRENQLNKLQLVVKEVADIAPSDPRVLALRGRLAMVQQRFNEALKPLRKLVTKEPDSIVARVLLGECYMKLGQLDDARNQSEQALKINKFEISALLLQSAIDTLDKRYQAAIDGSRKVQKLNPQLYLGYEAEGNAYLASKRYQQAAIAFDRAFKLQPSSETAIRLAGVLVETGDNVRALHIMKQWIQSHADDTNALQYLGSLHQALGDDEAAVGAFEKVHQIEADNVVALNNLAWLYSKLGDPRALGMAEKAYQRVPDDAGIQDTYGWVLINSGQPEKGRQLLEQALKALPDVIDVQYHYAVALARTGQQAEAKKRLKRVLQSGQSFDGIDEANALYNRLP